MGESVSRLAVINSQSEQMLAPAAGVADSKAMSPPALRKLATRAAAAVGATACTPAWAASPPLAVGAWVSLGGALGLAAALMICWVLLRERVAPRSHWQGFAIGAVLLAPVVVLAAAPWPLQTFVLAVLVLLWGLAVVRGLAARMRHLLEERDHARAAAKQAKQDSERDALTGALNRAAWRQRLEQLAQDGAAMQPPRPLSVLFFDIDLFKLINDSLGHGVGDDCLRAVSATVAAELRGGDVLGRMGGEEFAVALPGAKRIHAIAVAERIRMAVQGHCRTVGEEVVELTVSIGAAEYLGPDEALDALVDRSDRAMYTAKDTGRNMVVADAATPAIAPSDPAPPSL